MAVCGRVPVHLTRLPVTVGRVPPTWKYYFSITSIQDTACPLEGMSGGRPPRPLWRVSLLGGRGTRGASRGRWLSPPWIFFFFFKSTLFIYLFISGCVVSSLLRAGFL